MTYDECILNQNCDFTFYEIPKSGQIETERNLCTHAESSNTIKVNVDECKGYLDYESCITATISCVFTTYEIPKDKTIDAERNLCTHFPISNFDM